MRQDPNADPEDLFAHTRMSFGEHLEELRTHMIRALLGFGVCLLVSFLYGKYVLNFITWPVEKQLMVFYNHRVDKVLADLKAGNADVARVNEKKEVPAEIRIGDFCALLERVGVHVPPTEGAYPGELIKFPMVIRPVEFQALLQEATRLVGRPPLLSTMGIMEGFMVLMKVCAFCAVVTGSPWIFWQMWSFIVAGLYPHEKRYVHRYLPLSVGLFLAGVCMCEFVVLPKAIEALLWFNEWLHLEPDLRLNEWLSFALILPLVFGLSFQTPLVMLFFGKLGIMDADSFRKKRRIAWSVMAAFAGFITPVDALSMLLLWLPMCALYELGILMVQYTTPISATEEESLSSEEMIEV